MSRITSYLQNYICEEESCEEKGQIQQHFVWSNEIETKTHACKFCKCLLKIDNVFLDTERNEAPALIGLHKERNLNERRKRNHKHFLTDILPDLDRDSKRHHLGKMGKKC